jgi:hypothetical protein
MIARKIQLDFYDATGATLLGSTTVSADTRQLKLTNAELQALLGGSEINFMLKARIVTDADWWQVESEENSVIVTKI